MSTSPIGREVAGLLFEAGAIHVSREQTFVLAAGWASPVYVDVRLLIGEPALRDKVIELMVRYADATFPARSFDAVIGAETAGIPFASWFADRTGLKLRYVRKRPLGVGRNAQIEGGSVQNMNVLLMDDLTTDGGSKLAFARGLRSGGAILDHVLTIFYQDVFPNAGVRLTQAGLTLHAMATWADVLFVDDGKWLDPADRAEIELFLANPVDWSARHGGRAGNASRI